MEKEIMEAPYKVELFKENGRVRITCLTKEKVWHKVRATFNKKWYDEPLFYFNFEFPDIFHFNEISGININDIGFILFQSQEEESAYHKHHFVDYKKIEDTQEEFKPCILVSSFPNTLEKENFLAKHLMSLKKAGLPVFLCSNMLIKEEIVKIADHFIYTGPNQMYSILDFFDLKSAIRKVVSDFKPLKVIDGIENGPVIFHDMNQQIYSKKNYYWPAINSSKKAFQTLNAWGYTHVMKSEGEFLLSEKDKGIPLEKLKEMHQNNIQGEYFIRSENFHIEAFVYFAQIPFLSKVYSSFTPKDFFESGTTPENFVKYRIFFSGIYNRIRVKIFDEFRDFTRRRSWAPEETVEVIGLEENLGSIHTFFPNTDVIRYSHNTEVLHQVSAIENLELEVLPNNRTMKNWRITTRNFAAGINQEPMIVNVSFLNSKREVMEKSVFLLTPRQYVIIGEKVFSEECLYVEYDAQYVSESSKLEKVLTTRSFDFNGFFETKS